MKSRRVLVAIDVQNGFVNEHSRHVVPMIRTTVRKWIAGGGDVVLTRYHNYEGSPYDRLIGWRGLMHSPETELVSELAEFANHPNASVLNKTTYTALTPQGRDLLQPYTDLYLCGIATDGCVLKTALDAFDSGFTPWVIEDACASNATRHPAAEVHQSALTLMSRLIGAGQLTRAETVMSSIEAEQIRHSA